MTSTETLLVIMNIVVIITLASWEPGALIVYCIGALIGIVLYENTGVEESAVTTEVSRRHKASIPKCYPKEVYDTLAICP